MIRVYHLLNKSSELQNLLKLTKQNCLHAEPNYGVLWFYFKSSMLDNAIDVWENAEFELRNQV